jgi:hypothetical protein
VDKECEDCGATLSPHNPALLCWDCLKKAQIELQLQILDSPHYTVEHLRFLLGFQNPESVKRLGRKGIIPGRIPDIRRHLYLREEVDAWVQSGCKPVRDQKGQHFIELDLARLAIIDNYEKWMNSATNLNKGRPEGSPVCPIGGLIYGGQVYQITPGGGAICELLEVNSRTADNLLSHLRAEFTELESIKSLTNLTDDKHSRRVINSLKSHSGEYVGDCKDCAP